VKLLKLKLRNFKGIKSLELVANGEDLRIFGDNATGKTSILDGFLWLLFDKDSQNRSDFAIKTLNKNGEPIHHLDHEVEGTFEIDGETIELKKVYREKWVKKRGSATEEFSGHETDHFIDGVPVKKSEYTDRVNQIAPEDRFKLLTSPLYFNEFMKWQDRRALLIEIAGDVTMEDVIQANPELKELPGILGKRTPEDHKAIIMARRAEVNKELERIPIRIDEVSRHHPDIEGIDPDQLEQQSKELMAEQAELKRELADLMSSGNQSKIRQQIAEIDAKLLGIETDYKRKHNQQVSDLERQTTLLQAKVAETSNAISRKEQEINEQKQNAERAEKLITDLRAKWHEINSRRFDAQVEDVCPTCGQALPPERVQEAVDKAASEFNLRKAEDLAQVNAEGKAAKDRLDNIQANIASLESEIAQLKEQLSELLAQGADLGKQLDQAKVGADAYMEQEDYKTLVAEKEQLLKALDGDQSAIKPQIEEVERKIKAVDDQLVELKNAKSKWELYQSIDRRIAELQDQESELAKEFEKLERELYLIEEYIKTKAELLTDKINSKFRLAEFRLFEQQINGGINPVCITTNQGVPWSDLNSAGKVQVGLDIIRTLQEHYQFRPPVWIDNRESIVELPEMDCQVISLIVSAEDKSLRIEGPDKESVKQSLFEEAI
jgi:DNA repair exonuclease SbcCD ATPase subunit